MLRIRARRSLRHRWRLCSIVGVASCVPDRRRAQILSRSPRNSDHRRISRSSQPQDARWPILGRSISGCTTTFAPLSPRPPEPLLSSFSPGLLAAVALRHGVNPRHGLSDPHLLTERRKLTRPLPVTATQWMSRWKALFFPTSDGFPMSRNDAFEPRITPISQRRLGDTAPRQMVSRGMTIDDWPLGPLTKW